MLRNTPAPRPGLQRLALALAGLVLAAAGPAGAQQFALEGAVVDSRSGGQLGVITERGDLATLFRAQKALTFGILRSAGISLDQLSPEVRARLERLQTTNVEAFRAYSQGLDLKDQGRFAEAREQFRRAVELDPGFALAAEQQQAMPDLNLSANMQVRAVVAQAASTAVDRGRAVYAVDVARAAAALQAGLEVVRIPADNARRLDADDPLRDRLRNTGARTASQVVGFAYSLVDGAIGVSTILPNEWRSSEVAINAAGVLQSVGSPASSVQFRQAGATPTALGRADLVGGGVAYWGAWLSSPGASALLRSGTREIGNPDLGNRVSWVAADTPLTLPGSGTYEFSPRGGSLADVTGVIRVDTAARRVSFDDLGFRIDGFRFSGLAGQATYDGRADREVASAPFSGRYDPLRGSCTGCSGFVPGSSLFTGQFVGREAGGLVFSTLMVTGGGGTASGVHLFTRPDAPVPGR